jgi:hypothetical protein
MTSPLEDIPELISQLEKQMKEAAKNLDFEEAAKYRDRINGWMGPGMTKSTASPTRWRDRLAPPTRAFVAGSRYQEFTRIERLPKILRISSMALAMRIMPYTTSALTGMRLPPWVASPQVKLPPCKIGLLV